MIRFKDLDRLIAIRIQRSKIIKKSRLCWRFTWIYFHRQMTASQRFIVTNINKSRALTTYYSLTKEIKWSVFMRHFRRINDTLMMIRSKIVLLFNKIMFE